MKVYAPAKVNLALDVIRQYDNGYHELDMIMAPVSLYNIVDIVPASQTTISCTNGMIPDDNVTQKMVRVLKEKYPHISDYAISIEEHIPMKAGLAGASANAAAVLKAINDMESLQLSIDDMIQLGKQVGADVPFCVVNRVARVGGIGEKIVPFSTGGTFRILLVKPKEGVSTPDAFKKWHEMEISHLDVDQMQADLENSDLEAYCSHMGNVLECAAISMVPSLKHLRNEMKSLGLRVMMTGSGSTMMGFGNMRVLKNARNKLHGKYPFVKIVNVG